MAKAEMETAQQWPTPDMRIAGPLWRMETERRGVDPITLCIRIGLLTAADVMSFFAQMLAETAKEMEGRKDAAEAEGRRG